MLGNVSCGPPATGAIALSKVLNETVRALSNVGRDDARPRADDRVVAVAAASAAARPTRWRDRGCSRSCRSPARRRSGARALSRSRRTPVDPAREQEIVERRRREAARMVRLGTSRVADEHGAVLVAILGGAEPEGLARDDRPARRARDLLAVERQVVARRAVERGRQPLPGAVTQEQRRRPAQLIGAGLRDHVDHRRRRAAGFRGEAVGRDLELLHRLLRDVLERPADDVVVVVGAVDHDVAAAADLPGRRDHDAVRLGRVEVGGRRVAGHQQRQLEEVAPVERQGLDGGWRESPRRRPSAWCRRRSARPRRRRAPARPATASLMSTITVWPTSSTMLPCVASANPLAVTVTSTTSGGRFATTKAPSSPVGTTRDRPVSRPMTVTVADGTGRPCESRTSPRIVAVVACPYANDT